MLAKKINNLSEMTGVLNNLTNGKTINLESMIIDMESQKILLSVLNDQTIKDGKVRKLFISELSVKAEDADEFRKGQFSFERNGNRYSALSDPVIGPRYAADMEGITYVEDIFYKCYIKFEPIEFDIIDNFGELLDDIVTFKNVSAMVYPGGKYCIDIVR